MDKESIQHKEDKIIIIMKDLKNQDENLVRASMFSVKNTLIPNTRRYFDIHLMKSIDLQFVKNLIFETDKSKLNVYLDNFLAPELDGDKELSIWNQISIQGIVDFYYKR